MLLAEKTECDGDEEFVGELSSVQECAQACKDKSSLFIYGRQGSDRCTTDQNGLTKCRCQCQSESQNGVCTKGREDDDKYDLYSYLMEGKIRASKADVKIINHVFLD